MIPLSPFVALIPARRSSTRLPDKPLALLAGRPLVVHAADRARDSGAARVIVATDDREIAEVANEHGHEAMLTSNAHRSGTDRIAEVVASIGLEPDAIVVNVQGDEPFLPRALIRSVVEALARDDDCAMSTIAHPITDPAELFDANVVKVVLNGRSRALYFSRAPIPWERDAFAGGARPARITALRHIGLYAYRAGFLLDYPTLDSPRIESLEMLEQLRVLHHGHDIAVAIASTAPPPGIDTPEDLERARRWLESKGRDAI